MRCAISRSLSCGSPALFRNRTAATHVTSLRTCNTTAHTPQTCSSLYTQLHNNKSLFSLVSRHKGTRNYQPCPVCSASSTQKVWKADSGCAKPTRHGCASPLPVLFRFACSTTFSRPLSSRCRSSTTARLSMTDSRPRRTNMCSLARLEATRGRVGKGVCEWGGQKGIWRVARLCWLLGCRVLPSGR